MPVIGNPYSGALCEAVFCHLVMTKGRISALGKASRFSTSCINKVFACVAQSFL